MKEITFSQKQVFVISDIKDFCTQVQISSFFIIRPYSKGFGHNTNSCGHLVIALLQGFFPPHFCLLH